MAQATGIGDTKDVKSEAGPAPKDQDERKPSTGTDSAAPPKDGADEKAELAKMQAEAEKPSMWKSPFRRNIPSVYSFEILV